MYTCYISSSGKGGFNPITSKKGQEQTPGSQAVKPIYNTDLPKKKKKSKVCGEATSFLSHFRVRWGKGRDGDRERQWYFYSPCSLQFYGENKSCAIWGEKKKKKKKKKKKELCGCGAPVSRGWVVFGTSQTKLALVFSNRVCKKIKFSQIFHFLPWSFRDFFIARLILDLGIFICFLLLFKIIISRTY